MMGALEPEGAVNAGVVGLGVVVSLGFPRFNVGAVVVPGASEIV